MTYNSLFGFLALTTYIATLIPSNVAKVFPDTKQWQINQFILKYRRFLGLTAFSLSTNHALISIAKYNINLLSLETYKNYYTGTLAFIIFYLRIAYHQKNLRWSYVSLGFINWGIVRLVWQYNTESIWLAGIISLSILYIAQFDPDFKTHRQQRHYIRLMGCIVLCVTALFYQDTGIIPSLISFGLIFSGLGLRIRAFLFTGTITLILTVIYQLIILVLTYSFLKWIVGLLAGVCLIVVAAGFEKQRRNLSDRLQNYSNKLHDWQ